MSASVICRITRRYVRSVCGHGRLRSYLLPPGAVGGLYGSGCFHLSSRSSVCSIRICASKCEPPCNPFVSCREPLRPYLLLSWLGDAPIRLEERTDIEGLPAPDVSVDGPIERHLQCAAVEGAESRVSQCGEYHGGSGPLQDGGFGRHIGGEASLQAASTLRQILHCLWARAIYVVDQIRLDVEQSGPDVCAGSA